jgi:hypothetical protein
MLAETAKVETTETETKVELDRPENQCAEFAQLASPESISQKLHVGAA